MLVPKLVPEGMEFRVVGALHDMSEFVKHSIDDTLDGQKLSPISRVPQAKAYLPSPINIQAYFTLVSRKGGPRDINIPSRLA